MSDFLHDDSGTPSLMRKVIWYLIIFFIIWISIEIVFNVYMAAIGKEFEVHTSFFLTGIGITLGGKATQKGIEKYKS